MKDVNMVIIKGRIVHKFYTANEHSCIVTINDGARNNIKVFVCKQTDLEKIKNYEVDDFIEIEGNIQSTKRGETKFPPSIFCDQIVDIPSYDMRYKNTFTVQGTVKRITVINNECWRIQIATYVNDHYSLVPVVIYYPDVRLYPQEVGEVIYVRGMVQSVKKVYDDGNVVHYQNYVVI